MKKNRLILCLFASVVLGGLIVANVLDTFVLPHSEGTVAEKEDFDFDVVSSSASSESSSSSKEISETTQTTSSSTSSEAKTTVSLLSSTRLIDGLEVPYHLVDIHLARLSDLRTSLATDSNGNYGSNIVSSLEEMVEKEETDGPSVLAAINGDFPFWKGRSGYVVRNGVTYRESVRPNGEGFALDKQGNAYSYKESETSLSELGDIYQAWCFGPTLIEEGEISVDENEEIDGMSKSNNQRTAIGYVDPFHFYFLVTEVNGRRSSSNASSFALYDLAKTLSELGCQYAYNLDGGGSSALYYGGSTLIDSRDLGDMVYVVER